MTSRNTESTPQSDHSPERKEAIALWHDHFQLVAQRKVGGSKSLPADEFTWLGSLKGIFVTLRTTPRLIYPLGRFMTPSNARLRTAWSEKYDGHFIDLVVLEPEYPPPELLQEIHTLAQAADPRPVRVRRRREQLR